VLATLDCRNLSTASQAIAHQARALGERQKATAREAARLGELLDGGYAAPNEVEQKQAQSAANEAQIAALLAQGSGKALEVNDCILRAPFDGEVSLRLADPGSFVRPGGAIVEVVDSSVIRLAAAVPEIDFGAIAPRTPVRMRLLATGKRLSGEIARRAPAAEPGTRTIAFEVDLPNTSHEIPVGTTAELFVDVGEPADAFEVPLLAAKIRGKSATVFVVEDGVAKKVTIDVVGESGGSLFLSPKGLSAGKQVVTQGRSLLANNDRVVAKLEEPKADGAR
jgi:RND family efflux transporter MFP subunit